MQLSTSLTFKGRGQLRQVSPSRALGHATRSDLIWYEGDVGRAPFTSAGRFLTRHFTQDEDPRAGLFSVPSDGGPVDLESRSSRGRQHRIFTLSLSAL